MRRRNLPQDGAQIKGNLCTVQKPCTSVELMTVLNASQQHAMIQGQLANAMGLLRHALHSPSAAKGTRPTFALSRSQLRSFDRWRSQIADRRSGGL